MGNSDSAARRSSLILSKKNQIEKVLNKLNSCSELEYVVACELQALFADFYTQESLAFLAEIIYERAWRNVNGSGTNHLKLTYILFDIGFQKPNNERVTFKDIFLKLAMDQFELIFNVQNHRQRNPAKEKLMLKFYGKMFSENMVSNQMIHWLFLLQNRPEDERTLLMAIKDKVVLESNKPGNVDNNIRAFMDKFRERGILEEASTDWSTTGISLSDNYEIGERVNYPLTFYNQPDYAEVFGIEEHNIEPKMASTTRMFQEFLKKLNENPRPEFYLDVFKNCPIRVNEECAELLLNFAMNFPEKSSDFAQIVFDIQTICQVNNEDEILFVVCLNHFCERESNEVFREQIVRWSKVKTIGMFLGQLYVRDCIENQMMDQWLTNTIAEVMGQNNDAIRAFITTVEIVLDKLQSQNRNTYYDCLQHLSNIVRIDIVPPEFKEWVNHAMKKSFNSKQASSSVSEASPSTEPQQATGAIRKIIRTTKLENAESDFGSICELMSGYHAIKFEGDQVVRFECEQLENFPESTLRMSAFFLFINGTKDSINSRQNALATSDEMLKLSTSKMEMFKKNLTLCFDEESVKLFSIDGLREPNWKGIQNVGSFLGELYNVDVIDLKTVNTWFENIFQLVLEESEQAIETLLILFQTVIVKMKQNDPGTCAIYMVQADELMAAGKIPAKHQDLMSKIMQMKNHNDDEVACSVSFDLAAGPSSQHQLLSKKLISVLTTSTIDELKSNLNDLTISQSEIKEFAATFCDEAINSKDVITFSRIALLIHKALASQSLDQKVSFKNSLIDALHKEVDEILPYVSEKSQNEERGLTVIKFYAELYKLGFVDSLQYLKLKNDLKSLYELKLLHSALETAGMSIAVEGQRFWEDDLENLKRNLNFFKDSRSHFLCLDTIKMLENIIKSSEKVQPQSNKRIKCLIANLTFENISDTAAELCKFNTQYATDTEILIEILMEKLTSSCEDASLVAKLVCEISEIKVNGSSIKYLMVENCLTMLSAIKSIDHIQLSKMTTVLEFISELYLNGVIACDIIEMVFQMICNDESDNTAECHNQLMIKVGAKLEQDNFEKLEEHFKMFGEIALTEDSHRSSIYRNLIKLRENGWNQVSVLSGDQNMKSQITELIENLSEESMAITTNAIQCSVDQTEDGLKTFINALWKCVIEHPHQEKLLSKLVNKLFSNHALQQMRFREILSEFLQCRSITFLSITKENFNKSSKKRLEYAMVFIGELYLADVLSDDNLETILKPAKYLSQEVLTRIIALIGSKVSRTQSIRLKAVMMNLEDLAHEGSIEVCKELQQDLEEINEAVRALTSHNSNGSCSD